MTYNILLVYVDNHAVCHRNVTKWKMDENHLLIYAPELKDRVWMDMLKEVEIKINRKEEPYNG